MELRQYVRTLRGQWLILTIATLACLLFAAILTAMATPSYTSTTRLLVSAENATGDLGEAYQGDLLAGARVATYADLVTDPAVLQGALDRLELPGGVESLQARVSVDVPEGTTIIALTVTDRSAEQARLTADALAAEFRQYVAAIDWGAAVPLTILPETAATVPEHPASPNRLVNLALGLLAGLALGTAVAVLREYVDGRVLDAADATSLAGVPVLGSVPARGRRAARHTSTDRRHDAYRDLASMLLHVQEGRGGGPMVVVGLTRDAGGSAVAANVARAVARSAVRVVLIASDDDEGDAGKQAGSRPDLFDVLAGRMPVERALHPVDGEPGLLHLLVDPPGGARPALDTGQLTKVLAELHEKADLVLIDAPPLEDSVDGIVLAASTHGAILVVRPGRSRRRDLARAVERLHDLSTAPLGVILNTGTGSAPTDGQLYPAPLRSWQDRGHGRSDWGG